ncbi:MAG: hypothetical protein HY904_10155 [Deltaproteobacteria bacterium]|nr:hypothetical protein [Deltaproteobacteria bacterium]
MASMIELMRELKHLGELRKAGQISPQQEARLKEIGALIQAQGGRPAAARPMTTPGAGTPAARPPPPAARTQGPVADFQSPDGNPNAFKIDIPDELQAAAAESAKKADAALAANKRREPPKNAEEAVVQLVELQRESQYTPPETFYGDGYFAYGAEYQPVPDAAVELPLIDPRAEELKALKAAMANAATGEAVVATVTPGGVFLDDFVELYTSGVLSTEAFWEDEEDSTDPNLLIPGKRKVTVHMASGEVKRGVITRMAREDQGFTLLPVTAGKPEAISLQQIKAIFVNLNPGAQAPAPAGKNVTVMFQDRRTIQGATSDYGQGPSFTLIPPPGRGGVEKIIVNQAACADVR